LAALIGLLVSVEVAAGALAFHTVGELASVCSIALVALNVPVLVFVWSKPRAAMVSAFLLFVLLVPHQALFGLRWLRVRGEAERLVDATHEARFCCDEFPPSVDFYRPRFPRAMRFIQYRRDDSGDSFEVSYWVGTRGTSHWYDSASGWHYYPD